MIVLISTVHGHGYGAEVVLSHLLRAWDFHGEPLGVMAPERSSIADLCLEMDIPFARLATRRDALLDNVRHTWLLRSQFKDVRLVHAWHARGFELAWLLGRYLGVTTTGTLHDHPRASFYGQGRQRLMSLAANRFARLACVSKAVQEECRRARYRCPLVTVHNGLVQEACNRQSSSIVRVGFLGLHTVWKGFEIVEQWIRAASGEPCHWYLYGHQARELEQSIGALATALPQSVFLRGHKSTRDVFSEIDILIHASLEFDPLPTVLLESARAGIPVVAANIGGAPEIVDHGRSGFLFHPSRRDEGMGFLHRLIGDRALRDRMGQAAQEKFMASFRVDRMKEAYASFWRLEGLTPVAAVS